LTGPHHLLTGDEASSRGQEQRPGQIGGRIGEHSRSRGDLDTSSSSLGDVDVVEADCEVRNHSELRSNIEKSAIDSITQHAEQCACVGNTRNELVTSQGPVFVMHPDLESGTTERLDPRIWESTGDEDEWSHTQR